MLRKRQHYWRANRQMRLIVLSQGLWLLLLYLLLLQLQLK